jgi:hypothetical protein
VTASVKEGADTRSAESTSTFARLLIAAPFALLATCLFHHQQGTVSAEEEGLAG